MTSRIEDIFPLSGLQNLLLADAQSRTDRGTEVMVFRLSGPVSTDHLVNAWQLVHRRHAIMRACFILKNVPQPMHGVLKDTEAFARVGTPDERDRDVIKMTEWPLTTGPQIRLGIVQLSTEEFRLVIGYRQSMIDGWSVALLIKEFLTGVDARTQGREPVFDPAPPFRNYIAWLKARDAAPSEHYWGQLLAGFAETTPIRVSTKEQSEPGTSTLYPRESDVAALQQVAVRLKVTPNTVLQALWAILLCSYAETTDVVFGTAISGRPAAVEDVDRMIGVFFNNIPVRVRINDVSFEKLAELMQLQLRDANRYGEVPPTQMQEIWGAPSNVPLFQSLVLFHNFPLKGTFWEDRAYTIAEVEKPISTAFPLNLVCVPELGFQLRLITDSGTATPALREQYMEDLLALLRIAADDPGIPAIELAGTITPPNATALRAPRATAPTDLGDGPHYIAPKGDTEKKLAKIFEKIFNVRNIGANDNFFDLGARSMQLVQAVTHIRSTGLCNPSVVDLLEFPTIRLFAEQFSSNHGARQTEDNAAPNRAASARAARTRRADRRRTKQ